MTEANNIRAMDDELNTTAPQSELPVWKMPEPVFRQTSGKLAKGFEKQVGFAGATNDVDAASLPNAYSTPEPKPKNPTLKIILVVLGLIAMIAFLIVFLTVVYFFFLRDAAAPPPV